MEAMAECNPTENWQERGQFCVMLRVYNYTVLLLQLKTKIKELLMNKDYQNTRGGSGTGP